MRKAVIAGNWKMHMTCAEARAYADSFVPLMADLPGDRVVVLAPPFTAIAALSEALAGSDIKLSSQNVHWDNGCDYSGYISADMVNG